MVNPVKNNLLDAGCSEESAVMVERLCSEGLLDDALHQMRVIRCDLIPDAVHTDLYDGGGKDAIPFDKLQSFFETYLK